MKFERLRKINYEHMNTMSPRDGAASLVAGNSMMGVGLNPQNPPVKMHVSRL
jgi:hypothetical protein